MVSDQVIYCYDKNGNNKIYKEVGVSQNGFRGAGVIGADMSNSAYDEIVTPMGIYTKLNTSALNYSYGGYNLAVGDVDGDNLLDIVVQGSGQTKILTEGEGIV